MNEPISENLGIDIKKILGLPQNQLNDLMQQIKYKTKEREEERIRAVIEQHEKLIGKCFKIYTAPAFNTPMMWIYYKIISNRARSEYRFSVLKFNEYPIYDFNYQMSRMNHIGDYYFGKYSFNSIDVEEFSLSYYISCSKTDNFKEISLKEYNEAMQLYIDRLQKMDWSAERCKIKNNL